MVETQGTGCTKNGNKREVTDLYNTTTSQAPEGSRREICALVVVRNHRTIVPSWAYDMRVRQIYTSGVCLDRMNTVYSF